MATESQRKANFIKYYTANPDKLKGKSVYDAYAAMRREAGRQKKSPRAADKSAEFSEAAVERRLQKQSKGGKSPLAKGANAVWNSPKKIMNALPDPGFGSNHHKGRGGHRA